MLYFLENISSGQGETYKKKFCTDGVIAKLTRFKWYLLISSNSSSSVFSSPWTGIFYQSVAVFMNYGFLPHFSLGLTSLNICLHRPEILKWWETCFGSESRLEACINICAFLNAINICIEKHHWNVSLGFSTPMLRSAQQFSELFVQAIETEGRREVNRTWPEEE